MSDPVGRPFLERRSYRLRRLMDAARCLPWLGAILFTGPILATAGPEPLSTARAGIYVFAVWAGLIVAAGAIAPRLAREAQAGVDGDGGP